VINFRYHVVSLTAVFLSLAVGLVLGSTVLNGPMLDALNNQLAALGQHNQQLREQVSFLEDEAQREEAFATEAAPLLLDGALANRRVGMVVLPEAEDYAGPLAAMLELAGADITGTVVFTERFVQPAHRLNQLLDLAHHALPPSVNADDLPANSDGVETSAALLAAVLLHRPGTEADLPVDSEASSGNGPVGLIPAEDRRSVLQAYAAADYLELAEVPESPAEIVVIVSALPFTDADAAEKNAALLSTVAQFKAAGPVVLAAAGPAGNGNVVTAVRNDPELTVAVATVDNASTPQGRVATGLVVEARLDNRVGHYGDGSGAESLLPAGTAP
jgi:hypothetical protein